MDYTRTTRVVDKYYPAVLTDLIASYLWQTSRKNEIVDGLFDEVMFEIIPDEQVNHIIKNMAAKYFPTFVRKVLERKIHAFRTLNYINPDKVPDNALRTMLEDQLVHVALENNSGDLAYSLRAFIMEDKLKDPTTPDTELNALLKKLILNYSDNPEALLRHLPEVRDALRKIYQSFFD